MATHRGIESTCQTVVQILRDNYDPAAFNRDLEFTVLSAGGFDKGLAAGVSLFVYRVLVGDTPRTPAGRRNELGERLEPQLPVDIHFILTAWAPDASLQQGITGWMMRTMADHRVLPPGLLNKMSPEVFREDETVEVLDGELVSEDLFRLWELLGSMTYQISVPYLARNVRLESDRAVANAPVVRERVLDYTGVGT
jgi:hypothetical protein